MKYKDMPVEEARKICKSVRGQCMKCPLRRTKIDKKGKEHLLFCAYILLNLYDEPLTDPYVAGEREAILDEEIKYYSKD